MSPDLWMLLIGAYWGGLTVLLIIAVVLYKVNTRRGKPKLKMKNYQGIIYKGL